MTSIDSSAPLLSDLEDETDGGGENDRHAPYRDSISSHSDAITNDNDNTSDLPTDDLPRRLKQHDPLYVKIFYTLSLFCSIVALISAGIGFSIVRRNVFDDYAQRQQWESYTSQPLGMLTPIIILFMNALWTLYNLVCAFRGLQHRLWVLNTIYDFLLWPSLIGFGVLNTIMALWDRRLCDGQRREGVTYEECDAAMLKLLVVELVAVNVGMLIAVLHFILLIGRCCTFRRHVDLNAEIELRGLIGVERAMLRELMIRRRELLEDNRRLEQRLGQELPALPDGAERELPDLLDDRSLPPLPEGAVGVDGVNGEEERVEQQEDLIDMGRPSGDNLVAADLATDDLDERR
ncbi:hypothetical protein KVT40_008726 [Elsinoe batatas]|uniref:Uncharacterized protein n=1 Tax=Elsinoe batatas TaxID=2601811 RepID=A0A8K0KUY1_9PEZI|nr:hypothetical protein KVT40_008726 [Elsinoe batatas]